MGSYDFDKVIDRSGTYSLKWDIKEGELPMWVADMDFETAPEVTQALVERAKHGVFGYSIIPDVWKEAYTGWWERRHGLFIDPDWLIFTTGVIPAISSMVRKLTTPAEKVLIITPTYNIFFNSVINNGRIPVECPLVYVKPEDETDRQDAKSTGCGHFEIDWEAFEKTCADPQVSLLLFCNPQNPTGTIWDRETLERVGAICDRCGVTVISDEIHCDLICGGASYIPFASVSEVNRRISVTCIAPSKTFNLAGLASAAVFAANEKLRHKVWRGLNTDEVAEPNAFAIQSTVAALEKGGGWLDELLAYLTKNKALVRSYITENIPGLTDVSGPATYLCWLDARALLEDVENKKKGSCEKDGGDRKKPSLAKLIRRETGLWLSDGAIYGKTGRGYLRMNIAAPRSLVQEGLERLQRGISALSSQAADEGTSL